ncbi:MAG: DMT family transporter [Anaerolineales bacterium]|nr:MAG: DMT family transporter [Anaerolineales bacterium]
MKSKDWLIFIGLALVWGSSFFWIKIALEEVGPFLLVAMRVMFGLLGLLVVYSLRRPEWPKDKTLLRNLLILGFTNTAFPFVLISWAELHIDSAVASILNSSVPLFTTIIAHIALTDDKMSVRRVLGLLVGFAGVALLVLRDIEGDVRLNLLAQGAMILAVLFYAGSAVFARSKTKGAPQVVQAMVPLISATAFMWAATFAVEGPVRLPSLPSTWVALLWLGLAGSCAAYLFYYYLIHSVGPTRTTMVTYTFPVVGVTLGVLFLGEALDWHLIAGGVLILVSLLIVNRS